MAAQLSLETAAGLIASRAWRELAALGPEGRLSFTVLAGAGRNATLRIDGPHGAAVLRLREPRIELPGVDREREIAVQRAAAAVGLAPQVIAADASQGWLLMEHLQLAPWAHVDFAVPAKLYRLGEQLGALHALPAAAARATDPVAIARGQLALIVGGEPRAQAPGDASAAAALVREVETLESGLALLRGPPAMNHGDLVAANVLGGGGGDERLVLVDFEYAQLIDPAWELGALLTYHPALRPQLPLLLDAAGHARRIGPDLLALQERQFALLDELWRRAQRVGGGAAGGASRPSPAE